MTGSEVVKYLRNPSLLTEETLPGVERMAGDYSWFYPGWALYLRNLKNVGSPEFAVLLPQVALRVPDRRWLRDFLEKDTQEGQGSISAETVYPGPDYPVGDVEENEEATPLNPDNQRLIDNFLAGGGSFKNLTNGEPSDTQVDLAEMAVAVSDDIITETFAQLLVSQEKYGEAVQAFEKLSLRFPEKSIYFATRIEEIKNRVNH